MKPFILTLPFLPDYAYQIRDCGACGDCLFRSISYQLLKENANIHSSLRRACDYMFDHPVDFVEPLEGLINVQTQKPYTAEQYIKGKRMLGEYGDEPEILALSKVLKRTIAVYEEVWDGDYRTGFNST